jgi:hypothetical protein
MLSLDALGRTNGITLLIISPHTAVIEDYANATKGLHIPKDIDHRTFAASCSGPRTIDIRRLQQELESGTEQTK